MLRRGTTGRNMSQQRETGLGRRFYVLVAGKTNEAHHSIVDKLKSAGQVEAYSPTDCDYVLVICPVASRVQTDIREALSKAPNDKPVILVVMHHTFNPNHIIAESRRQVQHQNVRLTVDYFFYQSKILNCNRNDISWHEIQRFLGIPISRNAFLRSLVEGIKKRKNAIFIVTVLAVSVAVVTTSIYMIASHKYP
ncbi:uncharacterized protein LOC116733650 isoform X2 [Xiphophorus hellerii]|uniref:uncharacterized protein LOC116733650 isoform X2 n=1 Tax=Xiphophorus hellerii TaxID=8084 RepID=UPI0013B3BEA8|nr:uncharacterized protein LOC116733650 isoform X2 [Xiphophorus hellerii]